MGVKFTELIGLRQVDLGGLEQPYRRRHLKEDYTLFIIAMALIGPPLAAMAKNDFQFLGDSALAYCLVAGRFTVLIWAALLAFSLRHAEDHRCFDRRVLTWVVTGTVLAMGICLSRPADYLQNFAMDVATILIMWLMTGIGWPRRIIPPALYALGTLYVLWFWKEAPAVTPLVTIASSILLALIVGGIVAGRTENYRRSQFLSQHREADARRELETSLRELREARAQVMTLSGLLPICSNCKKIRDDKGYWKQIECYVAEHSEARFTHGLCPECIQELYPEYWDEKQAAAGRPAKLAASK